MTWENWQKELYDFEEWRGEKHGKSSIRLWSYLRDVFLREVSTLSNSTGSCLDVGCGSGAYVYWLVKKGKYKGIGLDPLKKSSLKVLKGRIKEDHRISEKLELIRGVGEYLPIKEDCVQLCIMASTLDHVNNPNQTLEEIQRVLVPDGYFLLLQDVKQKKKGSFLRAHEMNEFTVADLKRLLKKFRIEKIIRLFPIPFKVPIPDKLLDSDFYKALSRMPGVIGRYFNYSVAIIISKKN